jgi:hypothetical protein
MTRLTTILIRWVSNPFPDQWSTAISISRFWDFIDYILKAGINCGFEKRETKDTQYPLP